MSPWCLSCNSAIGFRGGSASVRLVLQGIADAAPIVSTELVGGESHGLILPEAGADSGTHWRPLVRLLEHDRTTKGLNAEE